MRALATESIGRAERRARKSRRNGIGRTSIHVRFSLAGAGVRPILRTKTGRVTTHEPQSPVRESAWRAARRRAAPRTHCLLRQTPSRPRAAERRDGHSCIYGTARLHPRFVRPTRRTARLDVPSRRISSRQPSSSGGRIHVCAQWARHLRSGPRAASSFSLLLSGIRYIPNDRVGVIEKRWSLKGSVKSGFIALNGEAGYQPNLLRGGLHYLLPLQYRVHKTRARHHPAGQDRLRLRARRPGALADADARRRPPARASSRTSARSSRTAGSAARSARSFVKAPTRSTSRSSSS